MIAAVDAFTLFKKSEDFLNVRFLQLKSPYPREFQKEGTKAANPMRGESFRKIELDTEKR